MQVLMKMVSSLNRLFSHLRPMVELREKQEQVFLPLE